MFNTVITTANKYEDAQMVGSLIDTSKAQGTLKEYQTVVAIGPMVHNINVGDVVLIDMTPYGKPRHEKDKSRDDSVRGMVDSYKVEMVYEVPMITIDGQECLRIKDRDIEFVAELEEEPLVDVITPTIIV